jgi:enoyl-CoA hydratase/carnithine racemase
MLVERYDIERVAVLVLNNPPANGYSHAMHKELDAHIVDIRMDEGIDVIVLRGEGDKFFCAGADIHYLRALTPEQKYSFCLHANETLLRLEHTSKLVIAALNGHCVGGGLEIALACDLRIGRTGTAKPDMVGLPEVALGVLPGTGGTQRLTRILGRAKALEFMVEGRNLPVAEALALGLVHSAFDADGWWSRVMEYASSFCRPQKSAAAVGLIKRAVLGGADLPLESALGLERELQQRLFAGPDAREGLAAFIEKRTANFAPTTGAPLHAAAAPTPPAAAAATAPTLPPKDTPRSAKAAMSSPDKPASGGVRIATLPARHVDPAPVLPAPVPPAHNDFAGDDRTDPGVAAARGRRAASPDSENVLRALNNVKDAVLNLVPRGIVETYLVMPLRRDGDTLTLAMADPTDRKGIDAVEEETGLKVRVLASTDLDITAAITRYYRA